MCKLKKLANGKKEGAHANGDADSEDDEGEEPDQALDADAAAAAPLTNGKAARKPAKRPAPGAAAADAEEGEKAAAAEPPRKKRRESGLLKAARRELAEERAALAQVASSAPAPQPQLAQPGKGNMASAQPAVNGSGGQALTGLGQAGKKAVKRKESGSGQKVEKAGKANRMKKKEKGSKLA